MTKLVEEQINLLEIEKKKLLKDRLDLYDAKLTSAGRVGDNATSDIGYDINKKIQSTNNRIKEIENLIKNSGVVIENDSSIVNIGTKFNASFIFDGTMEDSEDYVLVERKVAYQEDLDLNYISLDSPMGQAVFGKKAMDEFKYVSPNGEMTGIIKEIYPKEKVKVLK